MAVLRHLRAVTFDVGGTLIRPWPSVGHVYAEVAARRGCQELQPETLNRQFGAAWRAKINFDHSRRAWLDLVQKTFAGSVKEAAVGAFFDDLYDRFAEPEAWRVFDDVLPALEALRLRPVKLGIISNWDERLRPLLARLELSPYFEATVISVEAGFAKPAREIYARAASLLAVPADSILHIGDSLAEDIAGAKAAGLQALLLDRKSVNRSALSLPTLTGLEALLD